MNVTSSLQNSYATALLQNSQNQSVQSQSSQSGFAPVSTNMSSADLDGDNDNESSEKSPTRQQESASSGFSAQSVFSALNQNGSKGISTDQLLSALTKKSDLLSANNKNAQNNNLQNILMDKLLSSYNATKTLTQNSKVLSA
jgi:hypothetical protein